MLNKEIKREVLNRPIKDIIADYEEQLDAANDAGDIVACYEIAQKLSVLHDAVRGIALVEAET